MAGVTFVLVVYDKRGEHIAEEALYSTSSETIGDVLGIDNDSDDVATQAIPETGTALGHYGWKVSSYDDSIRISAVATNSTTIADVVSMLHESTSYTSVEALGVRLVERVDSTDSYEDSSSGGSSSGGSSSGGSTSGGAVA